MLQTLLLPLAAAGPQHVKRPGFIQENRNHGAFISKGMGAGLASLLLAVTTSRWFITQELWRIPAEEISSFQAAIFQERFHRLFRGRDSMKEDKENRR